MGEKMLTYKSLEDSFGKDTTNFLKAFENLTRKIAIQKNRRIFLLRCKHEKLQPTFLNLKVSHIKFTNVNLERRFKNNILPKFIQDIINLSITESTTILNAFSRDLQKLKISLSKRIPEQLFKQFTTQIGKKVDSLFEKIKKKNCKKITALISKTRPTIINNNSNKWVENLTNESIPEHVMEILGLGPNFATNLNSEKNLPINTIVCNIENNIRHLNNNEKDIIRAQTCNILTNHKNKLKNQKENSEFACKIKKTKTYINNNPHLKILRADKTNKTVIMNSTDYDRKMNDLLCDKKTYKEIKLDPTNRNQKKVNNLIETWEKNLYISPNVAKKLQIRNGVPPKIYGLPKLHKKEIPLRPIVSCIQSPFEPLSKFLTEILKNVINQNEFYIKDSRHFKSKIRDIEIPVNYCLISLDVISLYTNIPILHAKKIINKKWDHIKKYTDIPQDEFLEAIELTLTSTYFTYEKKLFKQIDGCAMGSSISSVIAQLVLEDLEETVIEKLNFSIPFFFRYVDDCITAVPNNHTQTILNKFNEYHKKLQFTLEVEDNKKINFLDITLHHLDKKILTEWYTKPTWSSRYLNFNSCHPMTQKKSVIIGLADRVIELSDPEYREQNIKKAKLALQENDYPLNLINKIFKNRIHKYYNSSEKVHKPLDNNKKNSYLSLPYINGLSQKLQNLFKKYKINVCHKAYNLLTSNFSKLKSKTPNNKKSNVVYKIPCENCDSVYIGQTSQYLENRIKSHKYDKKNSTALSSHEKSKNHTFNYNKAEILATEPNVKKREFLEMVCIKKQKNAVNDKTDIANLSKIYSSLL